MDFEKGLGQVAERYRREGYRVIARPTRDQLPAFAPEGEADLVAYGESENVLVQVKLTRDDLRKDPPAVRTADAVARQPGWRFDLVVLNPEAHADEVAPEASEPSSEQIVQSLDRAEEMSATENLPAACVMSWAALEAAMRQAARAAGLEVKSRSPVFLLRALYGDGLLDREEFDRLDEALKVRNAVVHGLTPPSISPAVPRYVSGVARKLLALNGMGAHV